MVAQFVGVASALLALLACVTAAFFASKASRVASSLRSMNSLQGELIEIRDHLDKVNRWAKRLNARETMTEHRATHGRPPKQSSIDVSGVTDKDELRRRAGLVAGQPARHNGSNA